MAYVPTFKYDVFISYAVADNGNEESDAPGWVDVFEKQLRDEISRGLESSEQLIFWRDAHTLRYGEKFDEGIREGLSESAILIVLLSKRYLASRWCNQERETFLKVLQQRDSCNQCIFVVCLTNPNELRAIPAELSQIHQVKFWREIDGRSIRLGNPVPSRRIPQHQKFFDVVSKFACDVARKLNSLREDARSLTHSESTGVVPSAAAYSSAAPAIPQNSASADMATSPAESSGISTRLLFNCVPEGLGDSWRWQVLDSASTYILAWNANQIWLWDATQTTSWGSKGDAIAVAKSTASRKNARGEIRCGSFVAVGTMPGPFSEQYEIYALTQQSEIVKSTFNSRTGDQITCNVISADSGVAGVRNKRMTLIDGRFGNKCIAGIYSQAANDGEQISQNRWLAIAVVTGATWVWSWNKLDLQQPEPLDAKFDPSGEFLLVSSLGPRFRLYRASSGLELVDDWRQESEDTASNYPAGAKLFGPIVNSVQDSSGMCCWYGRSKDGAVFCASVAAANPKLEIKMLPTHPTSAVASRFVNGRIQLAIAEIQHAKGGDWKLVVRLWFPDDRESNPRKIFTSDHSLEIVGLDFDAATERFLVFWKNAHSDPISFASCFPDSDDEDIPYSRTLTHTIPKGGIPLNSQSGLAAICNDSELAILDTQGFEALAQNSLDTAPIQTPLRWFHQKDSLRLITSSEKEACLWEVPRIFSCRVLPSCVSDHRLVKLTSDGHVVYLRSPLSELVVESLAGKLIAKINLTNCGGDFQESFQGLLSKPCLNSENKQDFAFAAWSHSHLILITHGLECRVAFEAASANRIQGVSIDDEFTNALVWDARGLLKIKLPDNIDEWENIQSTSIIGDVEIEGARMLDPDRAAFWVKDSIMFEPKTDSIELRADSYAFLSSDARFIISGRAGDELIYDLREQRLSEFNYSLRRAKSAKLSYLTDVTRLEDPGDEPGEGIVGSFSQVGGGSSSIEYRWLGATQRDLVLNGTPYNALLLSITPYYILAFGGDVAQVFEMGSYVRSAEIYIDRAVYNQVTRACVNLTTSIPTVALQWKRQDNRICVGDWMVLT